MTYSQIFQILQPLKTPTNVYQLNEVAELLHAAIKLQNLKTEQKHTKLLNEHLQHKQRIFAAMQALEQVLDKQKESTQSE